MKFEVLQKVGEAVGNIQTNVRRLRSRAAGTEDRAAALQGELDKAQEATVNAEKFMSVVRKYLSIEELTHTLLREMVEKIVVYECEYDENEVRRQRIDIYYSFVGKIDLPEE